MSEEKLSDIAIRVHQYLTAKIEWHERYIEELKKLKAQWNGLSVFDKNNHAKLYIEFLNSGGYKK